MLHIGDRRWHRLFEGVSALAAGLSTTAAAGITFASGGAIANGGGNDTSAYIGRATGVGGGRALPRVSASRSSLLGAAALALVSLLGFPAIAAPQETVLYAFAGVRFSHPHGGLVMDASGALYGTTQGGQRC